jgi:hypothetical protein
MNAVHFVTMSSTVRKGVKTCLQLLCSFVCGISRVWCKNASLHAFLLLKQTIERGLREEVNLHRKGASEFSLKTKGDVKFDPNCTGYLVSL